MAGINPFSTMVALILSSVASSLLNEYEALALLILVTIIPFFFKVNIFKILWSMKVMLITALLIFLFSYFGKGTLLSSLSDTSKFLSVVALSALYIKKSDLIDLSTTMGSILSPIFGKRGRKASSAVMMTLVLFPIIFSTATEMMNARRSRGGSFFRHPISSITDYTLSMMRLLFQKVLIFQDALYSRSWSTGGERTKVVLGKKDWLVIILSAMLFTGLFIWKRVL